MVRAGHLSLALWGALSLSASRGAAELQPPAPCPFVIIGLDTALATSSGGPVFGESSVQTFTAPPPHRAIRSITVWRPAWEDTNVYGMHLRIGRVDSTGRPIPDPVLLEDGPIVFHPYGDGVHPTEFRFEFDPPFMLPSAGMYFFAIQARPCWGFFSLLLNTTEAYQGGSAWRTTRTYPLCDWTGAPWPFQAPVDLVFKVEFCVTSLCGEAVEGDSLTLSAPDGWVMGATEFVAYGTPQGSCDRFSEGPCRSQSAQAVVEAACLGKAECTLRADSRLFGDPCPGEPKRLSVQLGLRPVGPDLVVSALELPEEGGCPMPVDLTIRNDGPQTAFGRGLQGAVLPFRTAVRLSRDPVITADDLLLATLDQTELAAHDSVRARIEVAIPRDWGDQGFVGVTVDEPDAVAEQVEVNNFRVAPYRFVGPRLQSVSDRPGQDQGGEVLVRFSASPRETSPPPVIGYELYRQDGAPGEEPRWTSVAQVPAQGIPEYAVVAPTLRDSSDLAPGRSVFFVRAATSEPARFFDSCPDSGCSVDNIGPAMPAALTGSFYVSGTTLLWARNREPDLREYRVYRPPRPYFPAAPEDLIAVTRDTSYFDPQGSFITTYYVSAVDQQGNQSGLARWNQQQAPRYELWGTRPHPARGGAVVVEFMLPDRRPTRLELLDITGRRVAVRDVSELGAGYHAVTLEANAPSGIYLVRLVRDGESLLKKTAVIR